MKKKLKLIVVLLMVFLLTGCVRFNATMDIKMDKSMDYTIIYAVDKTLLEDEDSSLLTSDQMKEIEKQGFNIEEYTKDNFEGYKISKTIKNIDEVSTEDEGEYDLSGITEEGAEKKYIFQVKKGLLKNKYIAKFKFSSDDATGDDSDSDYDWDDDDDYDWDYDDEDDNNTVSYRELEGNELTVVGEDDNTIQKKEADEDPDYSSLLNMDLSFNVKLPNPALSHNATKSEDNDKHLTWSLTTSSEDAISFEFELYNLPVVIGIGVVALLVVIGVISAIVSSGKKKKGNNMPMPVIPPQQQNNNMQPNGNVMNDQFNNNQQNMNQQMNNGMGMNQPMDNNIMNNNQMMNPPMDQNNQFNNNNMFNPQLTDMNMQNQNMNQPMDNRGIDPMDMPNGMNQAPFSIPEPNQTNGFEPPQQPMNNGGDSAFNIPDPVQSNLNK